MSLKVQTKEIYERYGLTDLDFKVYVVMLGYPQFTVSEVAGILGKDELQDIQGIVDKLEKLNFIKKIPGIVDRYIPQEPYFELFNKHSSEFRDEISSIKDAVLTDQSSRFENLEKIENSAIQSINTRVQTQVDSFFKESDNNDVDKANVIETAKNRFSTTSENLMKEIQTSTFTARDNFDLTRTQYSDSVKSQTHQSRDRFEGTTKELEKNIQKAIFTARDRFELTTKDVQNHIQEQLFNSRDRYESTSKNVERDLHSHLDADDTKIKTTINGKYAEFATIADQHDQRFTEENLKLNGELETITTNHVSYSQNVEQNLLTTVDSLNKNLRIISEDFKSKFDLGIKDKNSTLNLIVDDLLKDFASRVQKLELECKKDLDSHVDHHKEHADGLKPNLDEILEKYIIRMNKVIEELKNNFTNLLNEHTSHFNETSSKLQDEIHTKLDSRHAELAGQVLEFKKNSITLMDNLKDTSDRYSELAEDLSKRGSAWKALLFGKHKIFQERYKEIQDRISSISGDMKSNFENSTANYIQETGETTNFLKNDVATYMKERVSEYATATNKLDKHQQDSLDAELEGIAKELTVEIDGNIQHNIKHCQDTTVKLKDSIENSLHSHHEEYEYAMNKHRQSALQHYDNSNANVKDQVWQWYSKMDEEQGRVKGELSQEVKRQIADVNEHLKKSQTSHNTHSASFDQDIKNFKSEQRKVYDDLIHASSEDIRVSKSFISDNINAEINLIKADVKNANDFQLTKLNEQVNLVKSEFGALDKYQFDVLDKQMALFRSEIDRINIKQQQEIDEHIKNFKTLIATLDDRQHSDITDQKELFSRECAAMEGKLHAMLEKHKAEYNENATTLQQELTKTIETNSQDTKDAIADFTLNFMNAIDLGFEKAEMNESILTDIKQAALNVEPLGNSATWHVFGTKALLEAIIASLERTKSTITIVTPSVEPKILEALSQIAYVKKSARFLYTTNWDMATFGPIVQKMKVLGNIQFRNLKGNNDFYAVSRDGEEIVLCPKSKEEKDLITIVSVQEGYAQIFGSFIYPIFQANSRPI